MICYFWGFFFINLPVHIGVVDFGDHVLVSSCCERGLNETDILEEFDVAVGTLVQRHVLCTNCEPTFG